MIPPLPEVPTELAAQTPLPEPLPETVDPCASPEEEASVTLETLARTWVDHIEALAVERELRNRLLLWYNTLRENWDSTPKK